ncbi:FAD-dependent monooxygenase [Kovacikia minuta CCNUW1]|uniref:FAD-dependent oxidoreductase n=1 Tax=Kovacikia minuta TaxID=2931930 RepID=UPI001CD00AC0|nr:FAD-dependent monooxygenase [Kovacikia minuta]UBF27061.1 FAD-dependent monooxygenase [Kovacikia minuta CCNUW1]
MLLLNHPAPSRGRVGIIGAGTSGVYLASLLAQQGFQVALFEKAAYPRTDGCGIFLIQAGMKALQQGNPEVCQKIIDAGVPAKKFEFRNLRGGMISAEAVTYQDNELPGVLIHRKAILEVLLGTLPDGCLHGNAEFESVAQSDRGVTVRFKDGSEWEGDILVGSDGIFSKVRRSVVPGVELCYLGDLVWRGVVPDPTFCPEGNFIVYARGRGIYANFFDIGSDPLQPGSPKRTHWGFFIEKDQEGSEVGALRPQNTAIPKAELAKLPDGPRSVIESTPPELIVCRYSYDIAPLPHLRDGRIILIGDAAHAKSPTRARGMTAGFEDALCLSHHLATCADPREALERFEAERLPIVHEYQTTSRQMSRDIGRKKKVA